MLPQTCEEEEHPKKETKVTHSVDHKGLLSCISSRILFKPEADEEIRTKADTLPPHKHQQEVIRQYKVEHHEDEKIEIGEISRITRVVMHVSYGVDVDKETDSTDDQGHQDGERIDLVPNHCLERARNHPVKYHLLEVALSRWHSNELEEDEN